jgi:hypothetical protein
MSEPMFLTLNEVVERYRGQISEGTLRNWRSMRVGPSFLKVGKGVPYQLRRPRGLFAPAPTEINDPCPCRKPNPAGT